MAVSHSARAVAEDGRSAPPAGAAGERRAGGMAQGAKTPRKVVQWAASTKGEGPVATHHLDEEGLDLNPFRTLTYALEQHQSDSRETINLRERVSAISSSNSFTPTTLSPIHSDSSRELSPERTVPGEAYIERTETYGLPQPIPTSDDSDPGTEEAARRLERRATKLVRAHTRGFQLLAGFRGNKAMRHMQPEDIDQEAPLPRRPSRRHRERERRGGGGNRSGSTEDVEMEAARYSAPHALGSGVLSALLSLYDRPQPGTGASSARSTPGDRSPISPGMVTPEGEPSSQHLHERRLSQRRGRGERDRGVRLWRSRSLDARKDRERGRPASEADLAEPQQSVIVSMEETDDGAPLTPPHPLYAQMSDTLSLNTFKELPRTMSGGLDKLKSASAGAIPAKLAALPLFGRERPSAARSGGGVFGPLIASTGNLAGVAAPEPSRIAPNVKRPGYHLSRYSWSEEMSTRSSKSGARVGGRQSPAQGMGLGLQTRGFGSDTRLSLPAGGGGGGVKPHSAPATPMTEDAMSVLSVRISASQSPSPSENTTPLSGTPFFGGGGGHSASKSLDGATLAGTELGHGARGGSSSSAFGDTLSLTNVPTRGSAVSASGSRTGGRKKWTGILKDFPRPYTPMNGWATSETRSVAGTPDTVSEGGDYWDDKHHRWVNGSEEKKKRKRKKAEIYITRHVAEIMARQEFILKLARAFMMFGAPTHRLSAQIHATARVLDMELSCMYLPDVMLISFDDAATSTSNIKFIRQGAALNLGKLQDAYDLYWRVIHDEISVSDASRSLDVLMQERPLYSTWKLVVFGGFCSAAICVVSFSGSFIDALVSFPLGALLVVVQILSVRNELYSNIFEITIATFLSFMAAVLAGTRHFCYSAVASGSIVLILPGFLVLNGSLELSSRNIVSGAVRLCYAIMYALFLGFGLSIGGTLYEKVTGKSVVDPEDYTCASSHDANGSWYQVTPSGLWAFLTVPMFSLFLSLRNQAPWKRREIIITVVISCIGWVCNHFSALKFPNRSDVSSAIGAFSVGFIANLYGRFFSGNAFVIMVSSRSHSVHPFLWRTFRRRQITGILFQLPSGLGNGGLITFASRNNSSGSSTSYLSGFQTAQQLISVSVGLTVGLGISLVVIFPIQSRKRAGGIFSL